MADGVALVASDPLIESAKRLISNWSAAEWVPVNLDAMSETDQFHLERMVEIGVMRRREGFVGVYPGQSGEVSAVVTSTGEVSFADRRRQAADAAETVMPRVWYSWSGEHRPVEFDLSGSEYRLTSEGELARTDVLAGREMLYLRLLMSAPGGKPHTVPGRLQVERRWYSVGGQNQGRGWFANVFAMVETLIHVGDRYEVHAAPATTSGEDKSDSASNAPPEGGSNPPADGNGQAKPRGDRSMVLAFLRSHHSLPDAVALTGRKISEGSCTCSATVTRTLQEIFPAGHAGYVAACNDGSIVSKLAISDGDGNAFGSSSFQDE